MSVELTKSGKPVSEKTFGSMVCADKSCRHSAVELGLFDPDLRLFGRYLHFNGYKTVTEAIVVMADLVEKQANPFVDLKPKLGKVINFQQWKSKNI
ncbi:MAG TPA: hypothetical protein VJY63_10690 [Marinospirillum sp.]|uniref:hypothetical protein n=1 Tax=Marinospirillum sp. TaxID=2183934 RepID=UPI002B499549|nr:hypothetical protein [Marinospirillum sp.]HKM16367.1 hypothetical protein [Marinospirillum sp.]